MSMTLREQYEKETGLCTMFVMSNGGDNYSHYTSGYVSWLEHRAAPVPAPESFEEYCNNKCTHFINCCGDEKGYCSDAWNAARERPEEVALKLIVEYRDEHPKVDGTNDYSLLEKWLRNREGK